MNLNMRRNLLLCCAWIGSCIVLASFLWFFTRGLRADFLIREANRVIARTGDPRRLDEAAGKAGELGMWFTLVEVPRGTSVPGTVLVFTLMNGSVSAACAAFVDDGGTLEKIVPLSEHAAQISGELPGPLYAVYKDRIETAAQAWLRSRKYPAPQPLSALPPPPTGEALIR